MAEVAGPSKNRGTAKGAVKSRAPQSSQTGDLSYLLAAVNDDSSRAAALWLSFLTFMAYLTMTVGAVNHEALLRQTAIKLPVLNVDLPLVGFFWIAPLFFLLFHFYLFLQLVILVRKVASFDAKLRIAVATEPEREEYRRRLDTFLVVQFLCGAEEERKGLTGRLLRSVAVITLVILPIMLLLQFQLTFLPYHDAWVTWVHRIAILIDIRLAWVFWSAIYKGDGEIYFPEFQFKWRDYFKRRTMVQMVRKTLAGIGSTVRSEYRNRRLGFISSLSVILASFLVFAFTDEPIAKVVQVPVPHVNNDELAWELEPIADVVLHGSINMVEGRPRAWFSNVLVVPNKKLVDDKAVETDFPSLSLRGRNLSGAVLIGSDLRNVDFTGANLNDARLDRALLTRAKFRCASTFDERSKLSGWPKDECTWMQRASLSEAQLQAADFDRARMHGAVMIGANLMGAQLTGTQLQGAMLLNAQLQAALIEGASLNHAFLNGALLMGAKITNSDLQGVFIGDTIFQLTYLEHDKSKFRLAISHRGQAFDDAGNNSIPDQFMHAEFRQTEGVIQAENVKAGFDLGSLKKLHQTSIAQLAAANKMQYADFDKMYEQSEDTEWETIDTMRKNVANATPIKEYTIDFACNAGSSPYITAGLIRDEKIMWVLNKISYTDAKDQAAKDAAVKQAVDVLSELVSPACAGGKKLTPTDIVAIGFMKQRVESRSKAKKQLGRADNN
jgi:uncharacterized protein YjbI with pentapeptide repeats